MPADSAPTPLTLEQSLQRPGTESSTTWPKTIAHTIQTDGFENFLSRVTTLPPEITFAIRFTICVCAAIWISHVPGIVGNESQWILITVLMVSQPNSGGSLLKGLLRAVGTAMAAITAILLFGLFSQDPPQLLAGLFLVQAVGAYGFTGTRNQYAWFVFAFTTAIVLGDAMAGTEDVETIAFERASMVGIGLLIVFVTDSVLWTAHAEAAVRSALANRVRELRVSIRGAIRGDPLAEDVGAAGPSPLAAQLGQIQAARTEIGVSATRVRILRHVAILLEALSSRIRAVRRSDPESDAAGRPELALGPAARQFAEHSDGALEELAQALDSERVPARFADDLEVTFLRAYPELAKSASPSATSEDSAGRAASLRDVVGIFDSLQRAFDQLLDEKAADEPLSARVAAWLQPDAFRMQIALRTAIATCAALVVPMTLGWDVNTMVAPVAFMVAAIPTRGGAQRTLAALLAVVGLGWLAADISIVLLGPELQRMPVALLPAAVVAGTFAYWSVKRPQLEVLRTIGSLIALLTVYSGANAATDVYGSYNTVCYMVLALAIGWAASRILWPSTAATLFRQRSAAQIELCLTALEPRAPSMEAPDRHRRAAEMVSRCAAQLAQIAALDGQAAQEPVERGLDGSRRAQLMAVTQNLADAYLAARGAPTWESDSTSGSASRESESLREALEHERECLSASLQATARALRGGKIAPSAKLEEAQRAVSSQLAALRATNGSSSDSAFERTEFLEQLDAHRQIVRRQLALEAWLTEWATTAPA
jgi:uncharacterized membrane protein YccC